MSKDLSMFSRFKNWLKKSGVKYVRINGQRPLEGQEMIDSLTPWDPVIEHPEYPLARIYRESFWTGIKDTFNVLVGNHHDIGWSGKSRKGVLDLLIFPVIGRRLMRFTDNNLEDHMFLSLMVGSIGIIFEMSRIMLGGLLTLALTPVVAIVHAWAYFENKKLKENLLYLKVITIPSGDSKVFGEGTLPLCLLERAFLIEVVKEMVKEPVAARAEAKEEEHKEGVPLEGCYLSFGGKSINDPFINGLPPDIKRQDIWLAVARINERNVKPIEALLATNTGNILNKLKQEDLQKLQQYVKNPHEKPVREMFCRGALPVKDGNTSSSLSEFFHNEIYDKNLVHLVFDMAGIANEQPQKISRN
ncbi:MAG: hypothetical protein K0R24_831 [Gammaproteobacteria bacterium]|jgi:hypothetical protein|nr:hypothetical protein [Gammaproteobacteria bacterium]